MGVSVKMSANLLFSLHFGRGRAVKLQCNVYPVNLLVLAMYVHIRCTTDSHNTLKTACAIHMHPERIGIRAVCVWRSTLLVVVVVQLPSLWRVRVYVYVRHIIFHFYSFIASVNIASAYARTNIVQLGAS